MWQMSMRVILYMRSKQRGRAAAIPDAQKNTGTSRAVAQRVPAFRHEPLLATSLPLGADVYNKAPLWPLIHVDCAAGRRR